MKMTVQNWSEGFFWGRQRTTKLDSVQGKKEKGIKRVSASGSHQQEFPPCQARQ